MMAKKTLTIWLTAIFCLTMTVASAATVGEKKAAILAYLNGLQARHQTLSGVQVNEFEIYLETTSYDRLTRRTGKAPAIMGMELMGAIAFPPYKDYIYARAAAQSRNGGLVTLTWHERNPTAFCVRGEFFDCSQRAMKPETLSAMLSPGTAENRAWLADVDALAKVLKGLRDRGVVVLFRPYHEMNGGWFWWGKQDGYPQLWDALYEELSVRRGLDNLIWVWSSDRAVPDVARYVPKVHAPDIVGTDVYEDSRTSPVFAAGRNALASAFKGKPFAITEVGLVPTEAVLEAINPTWVLLWGGEYIDDTLVMRDPCKACNPAAQIDAFLGLKRFVSRDDLPATLRATIASGVAAETVPLGSASPAPAH